MSSRRWSESSAYADSKLHNVILAFAVARKWPDVLSNAVDPGWVATKMGGTTVTLFKNCTLRLPTEQFQFCGKNNKYRLIIIY